MNEIKFDARFRYDKDENIKIGDTKFLKFTHLLVEQKGKYFYESEHFQQTHDILETINCFNSIGVEYRSIFPVKIKTRPCIVILRRKDNVRPPQMEYIEMPSANVNIEPMPQIQSHIDSIDDNNNNRMSDQQPYQDETIFDDSNFEIPNHVPSNDNDGDGGDDDDEKNNIIESDLRKPSKETKFKLRNLIERHYRAKNSAALQTYNSDMAQTSKKSTKANIKHIIKSEKMKELIEQILEMDLRTMCNLEKETTKQCLIKIIDEHVID